MDAVSDNTRGGGTREASVYLAIAVAFGALFFFVHGTRYFAPVMVGIVGLAAAVAVMPNTRLLVYLAVFSLPFMTTDVFMLATGKFAGAGVQPVFVFTAGALCSILFNYLVTGRPVRLPRSGAHLAVLLFFGVSVASIIPVLLSGPPGLGASNYLKYANMTMYNVIMAGFYFSLVASVKSRSALLRIFLILVIVTDFVALYGVFRQAAIFIPALNKFDVLAGVINNNKSMFMNEGALGLEGVGFSRLRSTAFEAGGFADYVMTALPSLLCVVMSMKKMSAGRKAFYAGSAALAFLVFVATIARAAFVGFGVSLVVIALITISKRAGSAKIFRMALFFVLIAAGVYLTASVFLSAVGGPASIYSVVTERFSVGYVSGDRSVASRLSSFQQAVGNFEKSPLWGRGFAIAGFYSYDKAELTNLWMMEQTLLTTTISEAGIVGAAAFLVFFCFFVYEGVIAIRASSGDPALNALALGFLASFIGQVATRLMSLNFQFCHFWLPVAMIVLIRAIAFSRPAAAAPDCADAPKALTGGPSGAGADT